VSGENAVELEHLEEDADEKALHIARRSEGSIGTMSGAKGMAYMEYKCVTLWLSQTILLFLSHNNYRIRKKIYLKIIIILIFKCNNYFYHLYSL